MTPGYWEQARHELGKADPVLRSLIDAYHGEAMTLRGDAFFTLARSITGQQISVKAADSVWKRLTQTVMPLTPETVAATDSDRLRGCGLSAGKVMYLQSLAQHFLTSRDLIARWPDMDDEAIIAELTSIKGIGRWTAEMFLIFHLGRPDVFPLADIGLQKAVFRHYHDGEKMPLHVVKAHGERWKPWRSVATWYLWRALDPVPVAY